MASTVDQDKLKELARDIKQRLKISNLKEQHEDELHALKIEHMRSIKDARLEAENKVLKSVLSSLHAPYAPPPSPSAIGAALHSQLQKQNPLQN